MCQACRPSHQAEREEQVQISENLLLTLCPTPILNAPFLYRGPWHGHIFKEGLENHSEIILGVIASALNQFFSFFLQEEMETGVGIVRKTVTPVLSLTTYF